MPPELRVVRTFGVLLILMTLFGLLWFGRLWFSPDSWAYVHGPNPPPRGGITFVLVVSLFYASAGIGALTNARWGYVLLKAFLYVCLPAFPIGTLIGWGMLRYIRRHDIRRHFGFASAPAALG